MSTVAPKTADFIDPVKFESVLITTQNFRSIDIAPLVTDIDVFEHLDKPYLTAVLGFIDAQDVVGAMNLSGGEEVHITIKGNLEDSTPISKNFFIDKIMTSSKIHENEEFFAFHLIEDIAFLSNTMNINRSYLGTTTEIIKKISKEYLDTEIEVKTKDAHITKVIIPNLSPIDAMCWIKNRTTTTYGYPFYLYSNLVEDKLQFRDLESIMSLDVMNGDVPYTFMESQMAIDDDKSRRRIIKNYEVKNTYDMYRLINEGLLGSEYQYVDVIKPKHNEEGKREDHKFKFDIDEDVIKRMSSDGIIQTTPLYDSSRYSWAESKVNSRKITRIGSSNVFGDVTSLSERNESAQYKINEVSRAMSQLLTTDAMSFVVNGVDFLNGESSTTIGNKLKILFLRNAIDEHDRKYDYKKSGDYMIFACKHSFTPTEYTLTFSGVKLSNGDVE